MGDDDDGGCGGCGGGCGCGGCVAPSDDDDVVVVDVVDVDDDTSHLLLICPGTMCASSHMDKQVCLSYMVDDDDLCRRGEHQTWSTASWWRLVSFL